MQAVATHICRHRFSIDLSIMLGRVRLKHAARFFGSAIQRTTYQLCSQMSHAGDDLQLCTKGFQSWRAFDP